MKYTDFRNEEWKRVELENLKEDEVYEISSYGRVRYFNKETKQWKIHKTATINGYSYYTFFKSNRGNNHKMTKIIHRIVAYHFCKKPGENYKFVGHLNFDKQDNHYRNLRWMTHEEIVKHNRKNPSVIASRLDDKGNPRRAKLTETDVIRLKLRLKKSNTKLYKIAREFGISHTQLNRIRFGINWAHVKVD